MMSQSTGYIILDVRTEAEYKEKHIKNSLLVNYAMPAPDTTFGSRAEAQLPNKAQFIYVYCKAGVRSEYASRVLVGLGYTNVYDFGGLDDWPYDSWTEGDPLSSTWMEKADISWWSESGTNFNISTPEQLAAIALLSSNGTTDFAGQTITLAADIDLIGYNWMYVYHFEGVLDGNGKTISNMKVETSSSSGLFVEIGAGGTVKNLTLSNVVMLLCEG